MKCPHCSSQVSVVKFSRDVGTHVMRWHVCKSCDGSFETHEVHVVPMQPFKVQAYDPMDSQLAAIINAEEEE